MQFFYLYPSGYLSAGEGSEDDENCPNRGKETEEQRKQRLAQTAKDWNEQQKQKNQGQKGCKKATLNPRVYGPSWDDSDVPEWDPIRQHLLPGIIFDYSLLDAVPNVG